jgi:solute carrier family 25 folate transporter 32
MIAGASAGLSSSILTCPLDVVKTTLQAQGRNRPGIIPYDGLIGTVSTSVELGYTFIDAA